MSLINSFRSNFANFVKIEHLESKSRWGDARVVSSNIFLTDIFGNFYICREGKWEWDKELRLLVKKY